MTIKEFKVQLALGLMSDEIKVRLAGDPNTSKKMLIILSKDKNWYIRSWVAENPNAPEKVLRELSKDKDWCVKECVAINLNVPKEVLKTLL